MRVRDLPGAAYVQTLLLSLVCNRTVTEICSDEVVYDSVKGVTNRTFLTVSMFHIPIVHPFRFHPLRFIFCNPKIKFTKPLNFLNFMKDIGKLFGATFFSVMLALVIYDLVVKSAVSGLFNKYDNTFDPSGSLRERMRVHTNGQTRVNERVQKTRSHLQNLLEGRESLDVAA